MSDTKNRDLALRLLHADSESQVVGILEQAGLWNDAKSWRLYGDRDGNFSVIGNQQSRPEAALVEKIVNAVDARLMRECLTCGVDPTSVAAPQSVREAVASFIDKVDPRSETGGKVRFWPRQKQREQARMITLAVTGSRPRQAGGASITIVDLGEGQHPEKMPQTFLSIDRENKLRIPFVQGKFNMGGTGALKFCGHHGLQLVISRRCPKVADANGEEGSHWGFTIVRRERPVEGAGKVRNSVYRYLAPVGAAKQPGRGAVLQFSAPSIAALPERNKAYVRNLSWGSVLKLYEYDMKGFGSHALRKGGLLGRLEIMLPGIALPVRVHECRAFGGDPRRSFEATLIGLSERLDDNRGDNLEEGYPESAWIKVGDQELSVEIYAFKPDRAGAYRATEGIVFTINGQTHGCLHKTFFSRAKVKMGRLADSVLVMLDCSRLSVDAREDLFMNSRDRLSDGELRKTIEKELEHLVGNHPGLKALRDRRRANEIAERLENSKPLEEVLDSVLRSSPTLNRLFLQGQRLSRPRGAGREGGGSNGTGRSLKFMGKPHPTYFRFARKPRAHVLRRSAEKGRRCQIEFETDVVNDYFKRPSVAGQYSVKVVGGPAEDRDLVHSLSLHDGVATWSIGLPSYLNVGDEVALQCTVEDETLIDGFVNVVEISVVEKRTRGSGWKSRRARRPGTGVASDGGGGQGGKGRDNDAGIRLPRIRRLKERDPLWKERGFDHDTGCEVVDDSDVGQESSDGRDLTFYVNVSNRALETEMKQRSREDDASVVEAKFVFANVLVGLGVLNDPKRDGDDALESLETPEGRVASTTRALAPVLLPMIEFLGSLDSEEVSASSEGDEG